MSVVYTDQTRGFLSGYPAYAVPWIVFSAQDEMRVYASPTAQTADKKSLFLEPFLVLKKKAGRLQVAKYAVGSVVDFKMAKNLAQPYGWVDEKDVLLWMGSLSNAYNGFSFKGFLGIHDQSIMAQSERFMESDSVFVYKDPSLLHKTAVRLPINSIVYLFKFTGDQKKVLIGGRPRIAVDDLESMPYGWIDARMLAIWGERTALRMKPTPAVDALQIGIEKKGQFSSVFTPIISSSTQVDRLDLSSIFPLSYHRGTDSFDLHYLDHQLDYSENWVYTVNGKQLTQPEYRSIVKNNKKLNFIFLVEESEEVQQHLPLLTALFQGMNPPTYFEKVTYAAQLYPVHREVNAHANPNRLNWETWIKSFPDSLQTQASEQHHGSLLDCMAEVTDRFDSNQSNVIVILGQEISTEDQRQKSEIIQQIVASNSRVIFYQVKANYKDKYNDFVLFGEEVIKTSADELIPNKKQRLIDNREVVEENLFDLSQGDQGVYQLEYPRQSMHQGAVIFPKKGEENKPLLLQTTLAKLMRDLASANQKTDSTLTAAFQSNLGVKRTKIKSAYLPWSQQEQVYIPAIYAQQVVHQPYTFLHPGVLKKDECEGYEHLEYGVLLNEEEIEQLRDYYVSVYTKVFASKNLSNKKMIRNYVKVTRERQLVPIQWTKKFLYNNSLYISFFQNTGLYQTNVDSLSHLPLKSWKKETTMNKKLLEDFFSSFQTKADKIEESKGDQKVRLQEHQSNFYWLNQAFIPVLDLNSKKIKDQSFDLLPIELEKIETQPAKSESKTKHAREYIERVKRGMP
ncbi:MULTISPECIES: type VI secretion system protein TssR domain-containing protein [unclassified Myroides]|uniref:type VI secretion system protein TssR domain-containing protein n=1 Tax=unclassified Myroides TaxID=2642485 RepID=UPI003D2F90F0